MIPAMLEELFDSLSPGESQEFIDARAAVINPAWDKYLVSDNLHDTSLPAPFIRLVPSSDIAITLKCSKDAATIIEVDTKATDLSITKISDPLADNFMGYCREENCIVFKGERGLWDDFVEFAEGLAQEQPVTAVIKSQSTVRIPCEGLEFGLSYDNFANRVEVLECAIWIRNSYDPVESDGSNDLVTSQNSQLSASKCTSTSTDAHDSGLGQDELLDEGAVNVGSPSDTVHSPSQNHPPHEASGSSGSSSPLSPPPERIVTPPWLKRSGSGSD
ncbi:hypothetical protein NW762_003837 [Fusarium torreyae]|uniref:Uncharacterized protein n=1 Tax=Fusarium torreyae TaxID=1237075 RepID=A0A9W8SBQ2_9HYPO|nr:hypothetical protein NW762_003837 [Fusarium torreyae]